MDTEKDNLDKLVTDIAKRAREASLSLATIDTAAKNQALHALADILEEHANALIVENKKDLAAAEALELAKPMIERLTFTPERISKMAEGVRQVAALEDPVGEVLESKTRPNGLVIDKIRVPIGVVGIIYESRPNVTVDCAVLCLKSGNAAILRGGKEAFHTNTALAGYITQALELSGLPTDAVQIIPTTDRWALNELLKLDQYIHCIIPRGGESLIRFVAENSRIPVIKHYTGVCSVYVDKDADAELAESVVINAKTQRVSVCNTIENLFVHKDAATTLLPKLAKALADKNVELRVDSTAGDILGDFDTEPASEDDFYEEYLDYIIAIKVVDSVRDAMNAINKYGSGHSDSIITTNEVTARQFFAGVDSATVYWNASTRFTDGFEFGLGAEIGISTDRLHARGPMGLNELCSYKYVITGDGQVK
ncbi:glutamate-5-semialdehyde dehydrogenase [Rubellicoccus peritrichatus]|uniref:Gamma-glutamyl phosphate reductase n=1 Tax=Rubellicoccus peritrichatus TaxID=3080537 RepID=A0AAQ3L7W7_9BACT|nr:glutamate-5-semialdehyde dehydrogenase [Puniceicoccus sp. CR14]WOO39519.1 glutamate-5-semialdehyde dehydrogenase [Puniceicoccus sp. CR14]